MCEAVDPILHLPGKQNIADLLTRGDVQVDQIKPNSAWINGPLFLQGNRAKWPAQGKVETEIPPVELKQVNVVIEGTLACQKVADEVLKNATSLHQTIGTVARLMAACIKG